MATTEASPAAADAEQPAPETTTTTMTPTPASSQPAPAAPTAASAVPAAVAGRGEGKRKRGRPRKYGPDGSLLRPLNATPISASVPDDAGGAQYTPASAVGSVMKRGRGRPVGFVSRATPISVAVTAAAPTAAVVVSAPAPQPQLGPLGELVACASGANFTPHIINVAAGEVISFSQQGPRAICILSANGVIANVTLRQQDSLGGTVTYEGRFELLSLSGSFTPTDSGGTRSRSGGMSVSLAAADGRVIGGGVAGLLVAASPVQVVVGSFLPSYQLDQNANKKQPIIEITTVPPAPATVGFTISSGDMMEDSYGGRQHPRSGTAKGGSTAAVFKVENWTAPAQQQPAPDQARKTPPPPPASEAKVPVPGG
ncbi:AT-hook motif nuclear-localized protein 2-like isoform X2 [Panicum virgatum]|uniref:AT-hook motif nuclear-localized protein 2-like isoform X2 n=1 Tax=Panicum virgatum TaxID=38727 RepID=UPI0019D53045|nr:AT-hook motif nuclear-localized protein 2-like isoform X2 [Panicum virgatum]